MIIIKDNQNLHDEPQRYGLISMIAIIVGTVIGSGIYIKNSSLIAVTDSALSSMIAWIIGGLIILSMLIAFIEITSITNKKSEQGTFSNWSRHLWGEKTSKFIGGYFSLFYFPLIITAETIFASNQLLSIDVSGQTIGVWWGYLLTTVLSFMFLFFAFSLVMIFVKTGKKAQMVGTTIKMIPLIFIIFIAFLALVGVGFNSGDFNDVNNIFDTNSEINSGWGEDTMINIILIMPAVLFAFDGFLYASSMSNETKTKNTYINAAVISVAIITIVYITFSLSTFLLANSTGMDQNEFRINDILIYVFGSTWGEVLSIITSIIICLSILTSTLSYGVSSMWNTADGSKNEEIYDENADLIKRNKNGIPFGSCLYILKRTLLWMFIIRIFDLIAIGIYVSGNQEQVFYYVGMTDYFSSLFTVVNFSAYSIIIFGAIINRFTNKVEVEKHKLFFPAAIFAFLSMILIVTVSIYGIFDSLFVAFNSSELPIGIPILHIAILLLFVSSYIMYTFGNYAKVSKIGESILLKKQIFKDAYDERMTTKEYVKMNDIDISKYNISQADLNSYDENLMIKFNNMRK